MHFVLFGIQCMVRGSQQLVCGYPVILFGCWSSLVLTMSCAVLVYDEALSITDFEYAIEC